MKDEISTLEMKIQTTMECLKMTREQAIQWRINIGDKEFLQQWKEAQQT